LTRIRTRFALLALIVALPAVLAACGGGSDSGSNSEDPQTVLNETFNNDTKVTSGQLSIAVDGSAQGSTSGNFSASIDGPFQSNADDPSEFPQLDLSAKVSADSSGQSIDFDGGLIATTDSAFVEYQGQAYEVPSDVFNSFKTSYKQQADAAQASQNGSSASNIFQQLGIDPAKWLTNVTNEGTEDVEGTSTIHIHGDADIEQIFTDLQTVAQSTGAGTAQLTPQDLSQLKDSVKDASVDVYSGADDHVLRKLGVTLSVSGNGDTLDLTFSIAISDLNQDQTIEAPSSSKPLSDLTSQLGISLGPLSGLSGGTSGSGGGQANQAYLNCVQQASTPSEINDCASLLQ
jgi:hypothetical protein